jgi:hypothetical protein
MLIVALSVGVAIAAFTAFVILCLGIRREDRTALHRPAPTFAAKQARRFTGLRAQQPNPPHRDRSHASDRVRADA